MKMPKELKERWVAALRSGEYKQGKRELCNFTQQSYCCLGVLEMIADGEVETENLKHFDGTKISKTLPSAQWYEAHGISAYDYSETTPGTLAELNDTGMSFSDIADYIEKNMEVSDEG